MTAEEALRLGHPVAHIVLYRAIERRDRDQLLIEEHFRRRQAR